MAKLATADHVDAIIRVLTTDGWLSDRGWERARDSLDDATGKPLYADRADWETGTGRRVTAPLAKSAFKRLSKRKAGDEVRRSFSTPDMGIEADTFEKDGRIVRIEFRVLAVPYIENRVAETRVVAGDDIPAAPAPETVGYDVVDRATLEAMVVDAAIAHMIADGSEGYETADDVRADYDPFTFGTAVHEGFPYTARVRDDLARVQFDNENTEIEFEAPGFEGFSAIGDLTFLGVLAGGDWEAPVVFILYMHAGELRGYVPDGGNQYDRRKLRAWGNGDSEHDEEMMEKADDTPWDVAALRADIAARFGIDAS
jgi:hypothetical protein